MASYAIQLFLIVGSLAMLFQMVLAVNQEQQLVIEGIKASDFGQILECLGALPTFGKCSADIFKILEGAQKVSLSKNCCGAIFNIATKCKLTMLRINPMFTKLVIEACVRGSVLPPAQAVDKDFSWPNLF